MTSTIIEDMAALLVKIGRCPLPPDLADEVREILERIRKDGFYPEPMTNIDWLLQERMLQKQRQESIRIMKEMIRRETDGERRRKKDASKGGAE